MAEHTRTLDFKIAFAIGLATFQLVVTGAKVAVLFVSASGVLQHIEDYLFPVYRYLSSRLH